MEKPKPKEADPRWNHVQLDRAVVAKLPPKCEVLSVMSSGRSLWAGTVKIVVRLKDGTTEEYFKKDVSDSVGARMMEGAFEAERALHSFVPEQVPRPVAWGTHADDPDTHFYLGDFVDMSDDLPSPNDWATTVSLLHLKSMGQSPTGQFGFHVATYLANVPLDNSWNMSWEKFWAQQMRSLFDHEDLTNGPEDDLTELKTAFLDRAIPRYLRPLESDGRSIKPCLIHSDLWLGNIKPKASSGELCMFDACAYWGHNEADLGICRNPRYKLGLPCIREYFKNVPRSEPTADFEGRNAVYAMKYHALLSIMYSKNRRFRDALISELRTVISKLDTEQVSRL